MIAYLPFSGEAVLMPEPEPCAECGDFCEFPVRRGDPQGSRAEREAPEVVLGVRGALVSPGTPRSDFTSLADEQAEGVIP